MQLALKIYLILNDDEVEDNNNNKDDNNDKVVERYLSSAKGYSPQVFTRWTTTTRTTMMKKVSQFWD